jgi:predicted permease
MTSIRLDLRFALRQLARSPGFTAVVVLSLGLGIGGTTVMFGVLDGLLFQPPAGVRAPEEVVRLYIVRTEGVVRTPDGGPGSYLDFQAFRDGARGVASVAAYFPVREYDFGQGADAQLVSGRPVSGEFFPLLGVAPARGRLLDLDDDRPGASQRVVVLSHGFWHRRLGADPDVVGRSLVLDGEPFTVIGVASSAFSGINAEPVDLWTPLGSAAGSFVGRAEVALFELLARTHPEADAGQIRASAEAALAASAKSHPTLDPEPGVILGPLSAGRGPRLSGSARLALGLWLATGMLLLIACANTANLLLARAMTRRRELAVRRALGAGQSRIVRQLLTESTLLALLGGAVGLALTMAVGKLVQQIPELPPGSWIDFRVVGFALFASLVTGLLFGLAPAVQPTRIRPVVALNESQPVGISAGRRLPTALVTVQVALAVVLLVGAGICLRALQRAVTIDTGIDLERLVVASLNLRSVGYEAADSTMFYERAIERVRALPGVEAASVVMPLPLSGRSWGVTVLDRPGGEHVQVAEGPYSYTVGEDYFQVVGVRVLRGRGLTDEDQAGSEPVAVVSESLARAMAPAGDAVGMCVPVGGEQAERGDCTRIVGVSSDIRHRYLVDQPTAYVYRSRAQVPFHEGPSLFTPDFLVRTVTEPNLHLGSIRSALQGVAPDLPYVDVQPLETLVGARAIRPFRIAAHLLTLFGMLALLLAAIGLYGTLSHFVADRAREVGVRIAVGASRGTVVSMVIRRALIPIVVGLATGLAAAAALARLINAEAHGFTPGDPLAHGVVVLTLLTAAFFATLLPARRAARVDPAVTLKSD